MGSIEPYIVPLGVTGAGRQTCGLDTFGIGCGGVFWQNGAAWGGNAWVDEALGKIAESARGATEVTAYRWTPSGRMFVSRAPSDR